MVELRSNPHASRIVHLSPDRRPRPLPDVYARCPVTTPPRCSVLSPVLSDSAFEHAFEVRESHRSNMLRLGGFSLTSLPLVFLPPRCCDIFHHFAPFTCISQSSLQQHTQLPYPSTIKLLHPEPRAGRGAGVRACHPHPSPSSKVAGAMAQTGLDGGDGSGEPHDDDDDPVPELR